MQVFYQSPVPHAWIRQRPHEIAEGLAKMGHQVFWFYADSFHRTRFRRFNVGSGFFGLELPVLPFASRCRFVEWLNHLIVSWWLRHQEADVVVVSNPVAVPWLPKWLVKGRMIYDCMDIQTAFFTGRRRCRMQETERMVVKLAQCIFASSSVIRDALASDYGVKPESVSILPNGIDVSQSTEELPLVEVSHPSVAYFGTIAAWLDWRSVIGIAREKPEWSFDFFGPVVKSPGTLPVNVHLRGSIPHARVQAQARASDVLVMPFVRNALVEGVDPVKMYEYLQIGRPIVSSWWPLLEKFRDFPAVSFYEGMESFGEMIQQALLRAKRHLPPIEFLAANSWSHRVSEFERLMRRTLDD